MKISLNKLLSRIAVLLILLLPLVAYWQRQDLYDWWRLRGYDPPAAIASLAADVQMSDQARHVFYVNHPELLDQVETFRQVCTIHEQTIVLGCYQSGSRGIYIYQVKDDRLSGIAQVTAAHEMLHAAYDRLSSDERDRVNQLLQSYYDTQLGDDRIKEVIDSYRKAEPDDLLNEMHSIFGTEIASLSPELERYYQRYFKSRQAVITYSSRYEDEFTRRFKLAKSYEAQLDSLKAEIDAQEQSLKAEQTSLESERAKLEQLRRSGRTEEFNAAVVSFNNRVDAYNDKVEAYKRDVSSYNSILEQYNQVAGELRGLYEAIDTRLTTQSAH